MVTSASGGVVGVAGTDFIVVTEWVIADYGCRESSLRLCNVCVQ